MPQESPLVIRLQEMCLDSGTSITALVRTAKLIAIKLDVTDATTWINYELDGYVGARKSQVPQYRMLTGHSQAFNPYRGWQPVEFSDSRSQALFTQVPYTHPISGLESMLQEGNSDMTLGYPFELENALRKSGDGVHSMFRLLVPRNQIVDIVSAVRNLTLDWSLTLEKSGILGENMRFSVNERAEAKNVTHQFFIQNAGVVGNVTDHAVVTNHQQATVSLPIERVVDLIAQTRGAVGSLPSTAQTSIAELLDQLEPEVAKPNPDQSKLRSALTSMKTVCEGAAGNIVASGILAAISSLLNS